MKPAMRFALIVALGAALSFLAPRVALAQSTDDAHTLCAQGGGPSAGDPNDSGVGSADQGGNVSSSVDSGDPGSGASGGAGGSGGGSSADGGAGGGSLSSFAHAPATSDNANAGGGGAGAGLGGSSAGGGAGGCGPDTGEVLRRLPITGSPSDKVGFMGAGFVLLGGVLLASRLWIRRAAAAPAGLVWDAFGPRSR